MKAVVLRGAGGVDVLGIRDVPEPRFGPDELRVRVHAAALNRADLLQRLGRYPAPAGSPADIPGLEFSGEVEACGVNVTRFRPGDRVMGILGGGAQAEKVVAHEGVCMGVPPGLALEEAAAIPEAFLTAYDGLVLKGRLALGEAVAITAAGSGVGTAAVQIAREGGARVIALSRSGWKRDRLRELGAIEAVDPAAPDALERILQAAGGDGIRLAFDLAGASSWELLLEAVGPQGRLVLVGTLGGAKVQADLSRLMRKRLQVIGSVLRSRPLDEKIGLVRSFSRGLLPLVAAGRIRPVVDRVLPFEEVARAHELLERNETFGKLVLRVG